MCHSHKCLDLPLTRLLMVRIQVKYVLSLGLKKGIEFSEADYLDGSLDKSMLNILRETIIVITI